MSEALFRATVARLQERDGGLFLSSLIYELQRAAISKLVVEEFVDTRGSPHNFSNAHAVSLRDLLQRSGGLIVDVDVQSGLLCGAGWVRHGRVPWQVRCVLGGGLADRVSVVLVAYSMSGSLSSACACVTIFTR